MTATCTATRPERPTASASAFLLIISVIATGVRKFARALKNRGHARMLAAMDDRMLADIGLNRSDLRDAYSEPLWRDPTDILAGRACEKRRYRRAGYAPSRVDAPPLAPAAPSRQRSHPAITGSHS